MIPPASMSGPIEAPPIRWRSTVTILIPSAQTGGPIEVRLCTSEAVVARLGSALCWAAPLKHRPGRPSAGPIRIFRPHRRAAPLKHRRHGQRCNRHPTFRLHRLAAPLKQAVACERLPGSPVIPSAATGGAVFSFITPPGRSSLAKPWPAPGPQHRLGPKWGPLASPGGSDRPSRLWR